MGIMGNTYLMACRNPKYTGYEASVSQVTIPYSWCASRCPGWDRIEINEVDKWVQQVLAYTPSSCHILHEHTTKTTNYHSASVLP
jgi:hypothetical protein